MRNIVLYSINITNYSFNNCIIIILLIINLKNRTFDKILILKHN